MSQFPQIQKEEKGTALLCSFLRTAYERCHIRGRWDDDDNDHQEHLVLLWEDFFSVLPPLQWLYLVSPSDSLESY